MFLYRISKRVDVKRSFALTTFYAFFCLRCLRHYIFPFSDFVICYFGVLGVRSASRLLVVEVDLPIVVEPLKVRSIKKDLFSSSE